jgi:hypothetical protein
MWQLTDPPSKLSLHLFLSSLPRSFHNSHRRVTRMNTMESRGRTVISRVCCFIERSRGGDWSVEGERENEESKIGNAARAETAPSFQLLLPTSPKIPGISPAPIPSPTRIPTARPLLLHPPRGRRNPSLHWGGGGGISFFFLSFFLSQCCQFVSSWRRIVGRAS